jgi:hypothetical protein
MSADFAYINLIGTSIEYDIDLSQATCGCNIALYMVNYFNTQTLIFFINR